MGDRSHRYAVDVTWTGSMGVGTRAYGSYSRDHQIRVNGKPTIPGSSDPAFRGARDRYNPEEMLVAALSACHMLWYLHLSADNGVVVMDYRDEATGLMLEAPGAPGRFVEVVLRPAVVIDSASPCDVALQLHERAHDLCYIANSINFRLRCEPVVTTMGHGSSLAERDAMLK